MKDYTAISLTQGKETIVDMRAVEAVSRYKWGAYRSRHTWYGQAHAYKNGKRIQIQLHRFIWENFHGPIPNRLQIDHINGDGLDNRIGNLRLADQRLQRSNNRNRRNGQTSSKYVGVTWDTHAQKWVARIKIDNKAFHLGCFSHESEAHSAYLLALHTYHSSGLLPEPYCKASQYKGVYWDKRAKKWIVQIRIQHKQYYLGSFNNELEASKAYVAALESYTSQGALPQNRAK